MKNEKTEQKQRLADALRANLRRRKVQTASSDDASHEIDQAKRRFRDRPLKSQK